MSNKLYNIYLVTWIPGNNDTLIYSNVPESEVYDLIAEYHESIQQPTFKIVRNKNDDTLFDSTPITPKISIQFRTELVESTAESVEPANPTED